jgi:hypothetical protein
MNITKSTPINIPRVRNNTEEILIVPPEPTYGRLINSYDTVDTISLNSPNSIQRSGTPLPPTSSHTPFNQVPISPVPVPVPVHCGWNPRPLLQEKLMCNTSNFRDMGYDPVDDTTIVTFSGYHAYISQPHRIYETMVSL